MQQPIFDVSGAVAVLNQSLEYAFPIMTIIGELDSFKVAKGKWVYANLKDDHAKVRMFGTVYMLPGPLHDGMLVEITAQPRLHPQFGFSFTIQSIRPVGEGSLKKAADLLRATLEKEGLFELSRKRTVPHPPVSVGLITSVESAAYADFIKIMEARWGDVDVRVYDAQVQGEAAIESLVGGVQYFNQHASPPEVLVLIRGGGSADDLSVFSTEQVVRAVAGSRIPTCVAIGHEVDVSLAELAADMRASTPSNAAELLFPDRTVEFKRIGLFRVRLADMVMAVLSDHSTLVTDRAERLSRGVERALDVKLQSLEQARHLLEAVHPRNALKRGYALVENEDGKLVTSSKAVSIGESLKLTLKHGSLEARVSQKGVE